MNNLSSGRHGLRAGWRILVYFALVAAIDLALGMVSAPFLRGYSLERLPTWFFLVSEAELLVAAFGAGFIMSRIEQRQFACYGLPGREAFGKLFWLGAVWGLAAITVLLLVMHAAGAFEFGGLALHGSRMAKYGAYWGVTFLTVGFTEEFIMRGYSQFTLTQGMGFWPAAVLLSLAFGGIHLSNHGEVWVGALGASSIGLFFCLTLRRTGTLWFAVGFHAAWDWGESYLYSVPDSGEISAGHLLNSSFHGPAWLTGGTVGPEGSVLVFVLIALLFLAFSAAYREVKYHPEGEAALPTTSNVPSM